jgi:hypothetical protein
MEKHTIKIKVEKVITNGFMGQMTVDARISDPFEIPDTELNLNAILDKTVSAVKREFKVK